MFIAALFITFNKWKQPKCPSADDCIKCVLYPYNELFSSKNEWCTDTCYTIDNLWKYYAVIEASHIV